MTATDTFLLATAAVIAGTLVGLTTGLLPGLHVNTVAPVLLGIALLLDAPLIGALLVVAAATAHTVINVVPTLAAPLPDDDTALVLLPIQRMAQNGAALHALHVSVRASWAGGLLATWLVLLVFLAFPRGLAEIPDILALYAVVGVLVLLVYRHSRPGRALTVFALAGLAGHILLPVTLVGPLGGDGSVLMPAFAGLYGAPLLVITLMEPVAAPGPVDPTEDTDRADDPHGAEPDLPGPGRMPLLIGTGCGILVSLFPGLTSATAGAFGRSLRAPEEDVEDVAMLSAVNTANVVGNTGMLLLYGATRSGAGLAVGRILPESLGVGTSVLAAGVVAAVATSLALAAIATLHLGPPLVNRLRRIPARPMALGALALLVAIVFLTTGLLGALVAAALLPLGMAPHRWGAPRALLMGFLLGPYLAARFAG